MHLQLVDPVVDNFGHFYPELVAKRELISEIIRQDMYIHSMQLKRTMHHGYLFMELTLHKRRFYFYQ